MLITSSHSFRIQINLNIIFNIYNLRKKHKCIKFLCKRKRSTCRSVSKHFSSFHHVTIVRSRTWSKLCRSVCWNYRKLNVVLWQGNLIFKTTCGQFAFRVGVINVVTWFSSGRNRIEYLQDVNNDVLFSEFDAPPTVTNNLYYSKQWEFSEL